LHFARIIDAQWSVHTLIQNGGWPYECGNESVRACKRV